MRGSPALKESKLCQRGQCGECPLNRYQRICPGGTSALTQSVGVGCVVHIFRSLESLSSSKWLLQTVCLCQGFAEWMARAACCQSQNECFLFCVLVSCRSWTREPTMLSADISSVQFTYCSSPYSFLFVRTCILFRYLLFFLRALELGIDYLIILFFCWRRRSCCFNAIHLPYSI